MLQPRPRPRTRAHLLPLLQKPGRDGRSPLDRFHERYSTGDGCWLWTGCTTNDGYGALQVRGYNMIPAHVIAYVLNHGDIAPGMVVRHADGCCRNCVNPAHLTVGTVQENALDAVRAGTLATSKARKLSPELVRQIRARHKAGERKTAIARDLGMNRHTVVMAINGRTWRHVTDGEEAA